MVMASAMSGLIGSMLGMAGNVIGSGLSYRKQRNLIEHQANINYEFGKKTALESPAWNREGLENAGYNPMLAVQNATSGVNSNFASQSSVTEPDYGSSLGSFVNNATAIQHAKNETQQTQASTDEAYANADKAKAEKATLLERMPWISKREKAEIGNIEKDSLMKEAQIHNLDETTRFIEKNYELQKRLGMMGIDTQRYGIDRNYASSIYNADTLAETQRGMRTDKLPFGFGSTYYDMRGLDKRMRSNNPNSKQYWHHY